MEPIKHFMGEVVLYKNIKPVNTEPWQIWIHLINFSELEECLANKESKVVKLFVFVVVSYFVKKTFSSAFVPLM